MGPKETLWQTDKKMDLKSLESDTFAEKLSESGFVTEHAALNVNTPRLNTHDQTI